MDSVFVNYQIIVQPVTSFHIPAVSFMSRYHPQLAQVQLA